MSETWIIFGGWVAAGLTLALYSFLYKDNPIFKVAEHLYVGAGMGYYFMSYIFPIIIPKVWEPLSKGDMSPLIPTLLGLSILTQLIPKIAWVSRYGFTVMIGYGAGMAIPVTIATDFLSQIEGSLKPLFKISGGAIDLSAAGLWSAFNILFIILGLICVLVYFFFAVEQKGVVKKSSNIGIYFLMLYFGAAFGNTVMGRFALLYGRFDDLILYAKPDYYCATIVLLTAFIVYFTATHFIEKKLKVSGQGAAAAGR